MKKLEELFDLPTIPEDAEIESTEVFDIDKQQEMLTQADDIINKIDRALPQVSDLGIDTDTELDELADLAKNKFQDLMDLGLNVEARYSGTILQTAGVLLGHAITAKQAKIDKKLRVVDLQLKKLRLDQTAAKTGQNNTLPPIDGQAIVLDRNELLKQILNENNSNSKE
jgi:hypothetical protein